MKSNVIPTFRYIRAAKLKPSDMRNNANSAFTVNSFSKYCRKKACFAQTNV